MVLVFFCESDLRNSSIIKVLEVVYFLFGIQVGILDTSDD